MPVNTVTRTSKNPTSKQLAVLKLLYRFRFGTTDLLARALELKDGRYIHTRLEALVIQEYIGKNYDSAYKLGGKPATYYLLPKAFVALKKQHKATGKELSEKTLRNAYKDKEASQEFIARKLAVFTTYDQLRATYGEKLKLWTKDQLNFDKYDYFPSPMPDAYLTITPEGIRPRARDFFLNYLDDDTPFFVHVRRLQKLIDYVEANEWEDATSSKLRGVLLVCESTSLLKRIRKKLAQVVDEDEAPRFCYTTLQALKDSTPEDDEVWQMVGKPLEVFGIKDI
ncbi:MAG TPA: replication-relaxation family protein [Candidatus Saccharimonadales bacterium]|nr:replication-relaxation family protein [Candidatus Saccharimonadales bacterium]